MKKICLLLLCVLLATCGCSSKEIDNKAEFNETQSETKKSASNTTNKKDEKETTEKKTKPKYTEAQQNELNVQYIGNGTAQYENGAHTILFSFMDKNKKELWLDCSVDITIKNGDKTVYSATKTITEDDFSYWKNFIGEKNYCASITINESDIKKGNSADGIVCIDVTGNGFGYKMFEEYTFDIDELPRITSVDKSSIALPSTPITLNDYTWNGDVSSTIRIDKIDAKLEENYNSNLNVTLTFTGSKTFGEYGYTCFNCRLINDEGFVVDSSMLFTKELNTGDKFNTLEGFFYDVPEGKYTVEIFEEK